MPKNRKNFKSEASPIGQTKNICRDKVSECQKNSVFSSIIERTLIGPKTPKNNQRGQPWDSEKTGFLTENLKKCFRKISKLISVKKSLKSRYVPKNLRSLLCSRKALCLLKNKMRTSKKTRDKNSGIASKQHSGGKA